MFFARSMKMVKMDLNGHYVLSYWIAEDKSVIQMRRANFSNLQSLTKIQTLHIQTMQRYETGSS